MATVSGVSWFRGRRLVVTPATGRVSWRKRGCAIGSLVCGLLVVAVLIGFTARNLGSVAIAVVGLGLTITGAWWAVTERMPRKAFGIVAVVLGAGGIVAALVRTTPQGDRVVLRLAVLEVLLALSVGLGRAALVRDLRAHEELRPVPATPPRHPVLICNPWSGGGKVEKFGLAELAAEFGVEVVMLARGLDLEQLAHATPSPGVRTAWAWREGTARRRSSPPSPSSTTFPSSACRPAHGTTSPSISGSTARTPD